MPDKMCEKNATPLLFRKADTHSAELQRQSKYVDLVTFVGEDLAGALNPLFLGTEGSVGVKR